MNHYVSLTTNEVTALYNLIDTSFPINYEQFSSAPELVTAWNKFHEIVKAQEEANEQRI